MEPFHPPKQPYTGTLIKVKYRALIVIYEAALHGKWGNNLARFSYSWIQGFANLRDTAQNIRKPQ